MTDGDKAGRHDYEKWAGRQGNRAFGTEANREGYAEYERERRCKMEFDRALGGSRSNSCWVATAYYGDTQHPAVNQLRQLRDQALVRWPTLRRLNRLYYAIGRNTFGQWWAAQLSKGRWRPLVRSISALMLLIARASGSLSGLSGESDD